MDPSSITPCRKVSILFLHDDGGLDLNFMARASFRMLILCSGRLGRAERSCRGMYRPRRSRFLQLILGRRISSGLRITSR